MSLTISGLIATLLGLIFSQTEVAVIMPWLDQTITVGGIILTYVGRYRLGDITWYGARK